MLDFLRRTQVSHCLDDSLALSGMFEAVSHEVLSSFAFIEHVSLLQSSLGSNGSTFVRVTPETDVAPFKLSRALVETQHAIDCLTFEPRMIATTFAANKLSVAA